MVLTTPVDNRIAVRCGGCETEIKVKPEFAGRSMPCPLCERPIQIPSAPVARVRAICSACDMQVEVKQKYCGKFVPCPQCKEPIRVPFPQESPEEVARRFAVAKDRVKCECPTCSLLLVVKQDYAGRLIPCPRCRETVQIPGELRVSDKSVDSGSFLIGRVGAADDDSPFDLDAMLSLASEVATQASTAQLWSNQPRPQPAALQPPYPQPPLPASPLQPPLTGSSAFEMPMLPAQPVQQHRAPAPLTGSSAFDIPYVLAPQAPPPYYPQGYLPPVGMGYGMPMPAPTPGSGYQIAQLAPPAAPQPPSVEPNTQSTRPAAAAPAETEKPSAAPSASGTSHLESQASGASRRSGSDAGVSKIVLIGCGSCGREVKASRRLLGQTVKCPQCGQPVRVDDGTAAPSSRSSTSAKVDSASAARVLEQFVEQSRQESQPAALPGRALSEVLKSGALKKLTRRIADATEAGAAKSVIESASTAVEELCASRDSRAAGIVLSELDRLPTGVQVQAIKSLGDLGDFSALPRLILFLTSSEEALVRNTIVSLGVLGDRRAVRPLLALAVANPENRIRSLDAVVKLGDAALPVLLEILDGADDSSIQHAALEALGRLGNPRAVPAMSAYLRNPSVAMRRHAAEMLSRINDSRAAGALEDALADSDEQVRLHAARGISRTPDPRYSAALEPLLQDTSRELQLQVLEALGECGNRRAVAAVKPFVTSDDEELAMTATEALGRLGDEESVSLLVDRLEAVGENPEQQPLTLRLVDALRRIGDNRAALPLVNLSHHPSHRVRARTVEALGKLKDPAIRPTLEELLRCDQMEEVKTAAARALGELGDVDAAPVLLQCGLPDSTAVRVQSLIALGRLKPKGLAAAIEPYALDSASQVRYQVAVVLGESKDKAALPLLEQLATDDDEMVHRAARKGLAAHGDQRTDTEFAKLAAKRGKGKTATPARSQPSVFAQPARRGSRTRRFSLMDLVPSSLAGMISVPRFSFSSVREMDLSRLDGIPGGKITLATLLLLVSGGVYYFVQSMNAPVTYSSKPPRGYVAALSSSADGKLIAAARTREMVELWDAAERKVTAQILSIPSTWVATNPDGSKVLTADASSVVLVDVSPDGEASQMTPLEGHSGTITSFASSSDRNFVATADNQGEVIRWNLTAAGKADRIALGLPPAQAELRITALSSDGNLFAAGVSGGPVVVWDIAANKVAGEFNVGQQVVTALAFSPDSARIIASVGDVSSRILSWDLDTPRAKPVEMASNLVGINHLGFTSETTFTATSAGQTGEIWDISSGTSRPFESLVEIHAYSPTGDGGFALGDDDKAGIYVYDQSGKLAFELNEGA